jgi:WD40 repeat protein
MHRKLITLHCLLLTAFLISCQPTPTPSSAPPAQIVLFAYRFKLPALIGFSKGLQPVKEISFSFPVNCELYNTFPAPTGQSILIELSCPYGQSVLFLDPETDTFTLPFTETDSHFLAWQSDGLAAYLKVDSLGTPQIMRVYKSGARDVIPISEFTYDLAAKPDSYDFTFTLSRGLGYGSELQLAQNNGQNIQQLYADPYNYISFARWSPDGKQIAFIKIPDTQTPFTVGELWVIPSTIAQGADGANAHKLADADAGHGYAANWSPDGKQIAFVVRENPDDETANQSSDALISNIYIVDVESGKLTQVTSFAEGRVETPFWSPDGNTLAFNVVVNGRMNVFIVNVVTGNIVPLETGATCCPAWMRK